MSTKRRIYISMPDEVESQVLTLAARLGVTKSQMTIMCVTAGVGSVMRAFYPEEAIPADKLAEIVQIIEEKRSINAKVG